MEKNDLKSSLKDGENDDRCKELVIDIPENSEDASSREICIYRVPTTIRRINEAAYTPQVISVGPVHYGKPELKDMEKKKKVYLKEFCKRLEEGMTPEKFESEFSCIIKSCEKRIRDCYVKGCSCDHFVEMILLDAVFIIEHFLRYYEEHENDFEIEFLSKVIKMDLMLLENQLPYFIFEELCAFAGPKFRNRDTLDFYLLVSNYFDLPDFCWLKNAKHFVHLRRNCKLETSKMELKSSRPVKLKYNATKLYQAGVKFVAVEYGVPLLDIEFENGVLKMPCLEVNDDFECVCRNIIALEQCRYPFQTYFCNYLFLLDHLVNTADDVELLVEQGIIVNWQGNNCMVADLINKLCREIGERNSCYADLCEALNKHYESSWNHVKATLRLVYFSNLFRGTGTTAAAMLLILTLIQTVIAVNSLF